MMRSDLWLKQCIAVCLNDMRRNWMSRPGRRAGVGCTNFSLFLRNSQLPLVPKWSLHSNAKLLSSHPKGICILRWSAGCPLLISEFPHRFATNCASKFTCECWPSFLLYQVPSFKNSQQAKRHVNERFFQRPLEFFSTPLEFVSKFGLIGSNIRWERVIFCHAAPVPKFATNSYVEENHPHISRRFHDFISDLPWVLQSNFYRRVPQVKKTPLQIAHYPPGIAEQLYRRVAQVKETPIHELIPLSFELSAPRTFILMTQ